MEAADIPPAGQPRDARSHRGPRGRSGLLELTAALVEALVARLFTPEVRAEAASVLAQYGTQTHEREEIRVRVAALKLSEGSP
ncbi:MAG TPA: hypothetical protein VI297_03955, partial [Gemmatimonadales bacterium]